MTATTIVCRDRRLDVRRPLVMGVVNATPDSFSDGGDLRGVVEQVARALALTAEGAELLDLGGQSAITGVPEISEGEEIERLVPVVEGVRAASDVVISVDTYRATVASAALAAGADIVNDVSGLVDPALAGVIAAANAGLVVMHTRWRPKTRGEARGLYDDVEGGVVADVGAFLGERVAVLLDAGIGAEQLILDPGPDFAKTAAQTVDVLRGLDAVVALGRPVMLALSRKDFVGVITARPPRERLAGTLAAVGFAIARAPHSILRTHDVAATRDFLAVLDVLDGRTELDPDAGLARDLRWQSRIAPSGT
jgi:dihydropteroate synthase